MGTNFFHLQAALRNEKSKKSYTKVVSEFDLVMQVYSSAGELDNSTFQCCNISYTNRECYIWLMHMLILVFLDHEIW